VIRSARNRLCCVMLPIDVRIWYLRNHTTHVLGHYTHTHSFNGPFSGTTQVSWYQKGKSNLDFTGERDSEWQWHQLGHMQVCTSLQTDNHASTPPLSFLQAGCPSCHPTNSVKALKAHMDTIHKPLIGSHTLQVDWYCQHAALTTGSVLKALKPPAP